MPHATVLARDNSCKGNGVQLKKLLTASHKDSDSAVHEDTLLHGEALFVVSSSDSKGVALEFGANDLSINVGAHAAIVEVTAATELDMHPNTLIAAPGTSSGFQVGLKQMDG